MEGLPAPSPGLGGGGVELGTSFPLPLGQYQAVVVNSHILPIPFCAGDREGNQFQPAVFRLEWHIKDDAVKNWRGGQGYALSGTKEQLLRILGCACAGHGLFNFENTGRTRILHGVARLLLAKFVKRFVQGFKPWPIVLVIEFHS